MRRLPSLIHSSVVPDDYRKRRSARESVSRPNIVCLIGFASVVSSSVSIQCIVEVGAARRSDSIREPIKRSSMSFSWNSRSSDSRIKSGHHQ